MTRTKKAARRGGGPGKNKKSRDGKTEWKSEPLGIEEFNNAKLENYYKIQEIVPENEWDAFMTSLKDPLPTTFRVTGSRTEAHDLNNFIRQHFVPALSNTTFEDQPVIPPSQIPWYPEGLAWQFKVAKPVLRKNPEFKAFHNFLVYETDVGNISRQEAVSMIPPLVLGVEPQHIVLDMCAAPGSKTAQLLEALHRTDSPIPEGVVIANDNDYKRTHMLVHQSARLNSPSLMVTNLDAALFPTLRLPDGKELQFDRILCDVPCSGDGTLRKNPGIWKDWQPLNGNGLHSLQLRILLRAMKMLKPGGQVVYSTCSLNPVENEAVLAAALNKSSGQFELADLTDNLPLLQRRPGMKKWSVPLDKTASKVSDSYESYREGLSEKEKESSKIFKTMFVPPNVEELGLERCIRIYPHLQDTGGFFVALLRKMDVGKSDNGVKSSSQGLSHKRPVEDETPEGEASASKRSKRFKTDIAGGDDEIVEDPQTEAQLPMPPVASGSKPEAQTGGTFQESPYIFLSPEDQRLKFCLDRLRLLPGFPSTNVYIRTTAPSIRVMHFCSPLIHQIISTNSPEKMRLISSGLKVFIKQDGGPGTEKSFRYAHDGVEVIKHFVAPESILSAGLKEMKVFLESYYPSPDRFEGTEFGDRLKSLDNGSYLVEFRAGEWESFSLRRAVILPISKSNASTSLMIDKTAKSAMSQRIFGSDLTENAKERSKKRQELLESESREEAEADAIMREDGGDEDPEEDV